jgi:Holliday junction resolvase
MLEILKQAGFKVCRENASLYLKKLVNSAEDGNSEIEIIVLFSQSNQGKPVMTVFERTKSWNVTTKDGIELDYAQDDALRVNSIALDNVEEIFAILNKFGYNIEMPSISKEQSEINEQESPIAPTVDQVEAGERVKKDAESLEQDRQSAE